jgi:hypothetical protein
MLIFKILRLQHIESFKSVFRSWGHDNSTKNKLWKPIPNQSDVEGWNLKK